MRTICATIVAILAVALVSVAQGLQGPRGLSQQVDKYLLDQGQDPVALRLAQKVIVRTTDSGEALAVWDISLPMPAFTNLDSVSDSFAVLAAPTSRLKRVNGKLALKTQAEVDAEAAASPEGIRKTKRNSVRAQLRTELTAAGFTNAVYTLDDVQVWLETATLAAGPEKKINKLITQLQSLSLPTTPVSTNE